ncbi:hypothetical protein BH10CHL1_BH10CHL1_35790 [soil metagenome]
MINKAANFPQTYQIQFSFHFDQIQRMLELAHTLPEDVYYAKNDYGHDSIHNTFAHLLGATKFWRNVIADTLAPDFASEQITDIEALTAMLERERIGWPELLATFDEVTLLGTITRKSPIGTRVIPIWRTVQHVILHGVQHQTELARLLTEAGASPGDLDFFWDEAAT